MSARDWSSTEWPAMPYTEYARHWNERTAALSGQALQIAILRSYTIEPIEPVLKLRLAVEGFNPAVWFGGFDQYAQEILDPSSALYDARPDLVLVMTRIEEILPEFVAGFGRQPAADWERRIVAAAEHLATLAGRISREQPTPVIVQNMSLARRPYFGVHDPQQPDTQDSLVHLFNRTLAHVLSAAPGVFIWDYDGFVRARGYENLADPKAWYVSRNPFKQSAYPALVDDLMRYVRSALGRVKKCIVVDLDNTLWGGVAGEDGIEGIRLGHTYPGNCYRDFQHELLALYHRGILLAINSKNNEADALSIIDTHPDMVLRRHHFAAMRINWRDKASNLRDIARELNIGIESLIFIDDNPAECDLVRQECPECDVVLLPSKPYLLPAVPGQLPAIENIRLTDDDRRKGEMYHAETARREYEEQASNLDDFLRGLQMQVSIEAAVPFSIPRIAQLTQKTNQFNMTTRRYTEAQIQAMAEDPRYIVLSVSAKDRFGDHGTVGVVIAEYAGNECRIDTFLLSCRVIGRGIEGYTLATVAELASARGATCLIGEFLPTAKNRPAAGIYEGAGFSRVSDSRLLFDLAAGRLPYPAHIPGMTPSATEP